MFYRFNAVTDSGLAHPMSVSAVRYGAVQNIFSQSRAPFCADGRPILAAVAFPNGELGPGVRTKLRHTFRFCSDAARRIPRCGTKGNLGGDRVKMQLEA